MDVFAPQERSRIMALVHGKNTSPEMIVRSLVHRMGYRFRLHVKDLPGKPDIVLPRLKKVILVNGCFWHQHPGCPNAARPSSNTEYWNKKLEKNTARDAANLLAIRQLGWDALIIWECEMKDEIGILEKLRDFLSA